MTLGKQLMMAASANLFYAAISYNNKIMESSSQ